jgi:hypothetical protein
MKYFLRLLAVALATGLAVIFIFYLWVLQTSSRHNPTRSYLLWITILSGFGFPASMILRRMMVKMKNPNYKRKRPDGSRNNQAKSVRLRTSTDGTYNAANTF